MAFPRLAYGTPRKLPRAASLSGRVVVLDIAFAAEAQGANFEKITRPFIDGLGSRLVLWIDHHDHARHADFAGDARFILCTKADHGACPEMVTPERVAQAGSIDTICCHTDFDGLSSAAKWIRGGVEPYPDTDADARAIDTRIGTPTPLAESIDRALRARPRDDALRGLIVRFLAGGAADLPILAKIEEVAEALRPIEEESRRLARSYVVDKDVAVVDARIRNGRYDKTLLLMLGQERAPISIVLDETTLTAATRFDSGIDLLRLLGLSGGMPTVVSVGPEKLEEVLAALRNR